MENIGFLIMTKRTIRDYRNVSIDSEQLEGVLDFAVLWGRSVPVHIEIGSGKGTFLVNQAAAHPDTDFLGIERANKFYKYAVDRIGRRGLANVKLIRTDAAVFLPEHIADSSVDCFHIYFPDPWPKKRHHKRRFICQKNTTELLRCLKPGGVINIATDHAEYFEWMHGVFEDFDEQLEKIDFIRPAGAAEGELAGTNFERKYLIEGRAIYTIALRKVIYST